MSRYLIVGAGPAGLMAADMLSQSGAHAVTIIDKMPSAGRRFLMAGRGGLNLTHSEPLDAFLARYGEARAALEPMVRAFDPAALIAWAEALGSPCFVGTSGRVFPTAMKASPLLRALLRRLSERKVTLRLSTELVGLEPGRALVRGPGGEQALEADAILLATGGASWPRLGGGSGLVEMLARLGVETADFSASNVGVRIGWSGDFADRFGGAPLKACRFLVGEAQTRAEAVVTPKGLEGGAVYALSAALRRALMEAGEARLIVDLKPDLARDAVERRLQAVKKGQSLANTLRKGLGLAPAQAALLRQDAAPDRPLAERVKAVALRVVGLDDAGRAISSAGGVRFDALDADLMIKALPGVFVAGELLDFDAPTGGYLLQAAFATGRWAALGMLKRG